MELILGSLIVLCICLFVIYILKKSDRHDGDRQNEKAHQSSNIGNSSSGNIAVNAEGGSVTIHSEHISTEGGKTQNERINNGLTDIYLAEIYTSLFAEEGKLKSEQIRITKQEEHDIEGEVVLRERNNRELIYDLKGTFSNKILTAEYYSRERNNDERGSINLKMIANDIFSGFCSFSKSTVSTDDEIRVSPYIWHAGEDVDLLNGTYEFCTECYNENAVCCCASEEIDMPVFLDSEKYRISSAIPRRNRRRMSFCSPLSDPYDKSKIWQMQREEKGAGDKKVECCTFFDKNTNKCAVYEKRPLDCRLFPFDIKLSDDKTEYVIGYYPSLCERNLPDEEEMKRYAHILRPYFFILYPYLHIITSDAVCVRLKNAEFKQIANFREFVF